jgi:NADH-ubiquinone oxidoreductase chain 4L
LIGVYSFSEVLKEETYIWFTRPIFYIKLLKRMLIFCLLFSVIVYFRGLFSFCIKRKHLLLILLRLEFVVLGLYFNLYLFLAYFDFEFYFGIIFLTIRVCEGALGLAILVSLVRTHGNDYFQTFNVL